MSDFLENNDPNSLNKVVQGILQRLSALELRTLAVDALDELGTDDLGDMRAGRFLALSAGSEPTDADASGAFMSAEGEAFDEEVYHVGGVNEGRLQFGLSAVDGKAVFSGGKGRISENGISLEGIDYLLTHLAENAGNTRRGRLKMYLKAGSDVPAWGLEYDELTLSSELMANGSFDVDVSGWSNAVSLASGYSGKGLQHVIPSVGMLGGASSNVRDIAIDPASGDVYMVGYFTSMNSVSGTRHVAKWNGSAWVSMSNTSGTGTYLWRCTIGPDGSLYVCGDEPTLAGVSVYHIGKWDGASWSAAAGASPGGAVLCIAWNSLGELYAGGNNFLKKWDGSAWVSLGTVVGAVNDIVFDADDILYAGGTFTSIGGVTLGQIGAWDGVSWSSLNGGLASGSVYDLEIGADGYLYVGGSFNTIGSLVNANGSAYWDGFEWRYWGDGGLGIKRIIRHSDGTLYALFSDDTIQAWADGAWTALNIDLDAAVYGFALSEDKEKLYVCGNFAAQFGSTVNHVGVLDMTQSESYSKCDLVALPATSQGFSVSAWIKGTSGAVGRLYLEFYDGADVFLESRLLGEVAGVTWVGVGYATLEETPPEGAEKIKIAFAKVNPYDGKTSYLDEVSVKTTITITNRIGFEPDLTITNTPVVIQDLAAKPGNPASGHHAIYPKSDGFYTLDSAGVEEKLGEASGGVNQAVCNGRLTLESGVGVSAGDQVDKTTLYFTPYQGNSIGLYDGSKWAVHSFSELSLSLTGLTASKPYDIFIYDDSGTLTLYADEWTNATTRTNALALQDGVYVMNGATIFRYLGTIYLDSAGKCQDTAQKRFVWNYANRVIRPLFKYDDTDNTYNSSAGRYYNNDATNRVDIVMGLLEQPMQIGAGQIGRISSATYNLRINVGEDGADGSYSIEGCTSYHSNTNNTASFISKWHFPPAAGYHFYALVQKINTGSPTGTWVEGSLTGGIYA